MPPRIELYRQANRAERVAREAAARSTADVVAVLGTALTVAGVVTIWLGGFYEHAAKKAARR